MNNNDRELKYPLLVRNTSYKNFTLLPLVVLPLLYAFLNLETKILFWISLGVAVILLYVLIKFQIEYKRNVLAWNEGVPKEGELILKPSEGRIFTNGFDFLLSDISVVKIGVAKAPEQFGNSQHILSSAFINALMKFELKDGRVINVPVQSKKDIKSLVAFFAEKDVNTSFDMVLHRACGLH